LKKIIEGYWFFISIFLITILIITNIHAQTNFELWVEAPPIFTIAKTESVNVYIKNTGAIDNNYTVTYTADATIGSHLINVYMPIIRTKTLKRGDVSSILARVTILGPVTGGWVQFTVTPDSGAPDTSPQILLITGSPINLPEFELIGLIQLLILASLLLIISYSSHFR